MGDSPQSKSDRQARKKPQTEEEDNQASKCCLYVGNLSYRINDSLFRSQFEKFGEVDYANIVYEPGHKSEQLSRGYGFVKFRHEEDAIAAHKALNKKELYGKQWVIQFSKRDKPRAETPGRYLGHKKREINNRYDGGGGGGRRYQRDRSPSSRSSGSRRRVRKGDSRQRRRDSKERRYSYERDKDRDQRREKERSRDREYERRRYRDSSENERNQRRRRSRSNSYTRRR